MKYRALRCQSERYMRTCFGSRGRGQRGAKYTHARTLRTQKIPLIIPSTFLSQTSLLTLFSSVRKKTHNYDSHKKAERMQLHMLTALPQSSGKIYSTFKTRFLKSVSFELLQRHRHSRLHTTSEDLDQVMCNKHVITLSLVITQGAQNLITVYFTDNYCIHLFEYNGLWRGIVQKHFPIWLWST